jgi:hypothetical protein
MNERCEEDMQERLVERMEGKETEESRVEERSEGRQ